MPEAAIFATLRPVFGRLHLAQGRGIGKEGGLFVGHSKSAGESRAFWAAPIRDFPRTNFEDGGLE
jgi:hypothetical protein